MKLQGQWFGNLDPASGPDGNLLLNLDRRRGGFSGTLIIAERQGLPGERHAITIYPKENDREFTGHTDLRDYFSKDRSGRVYIIPRADILKEFPHIIEQVHTDITGAVKENSLTAIYRQGGQEIGSATCRRFETREATAVQRKPLSWDGFKAMASRVTHESPLSIYRGQQKDWPLRTSFHRANRYDLHRFATESMLRLESAITSVLDTTFKRDDAEHIGALLGIAQHHGFPTPLLDWTKSPYVAAYFACREAVQGNVSAPTVFRFDRESWISRYEVANDINQPLPSLAFIEPLPLKNARLLPQQSVLVYCNVNDFEAFVENREKQNNESYLSGYTITDAPGAVLRDLRMMGVYAASLFPGLDGMCRGVFEDSLESEEI